MEDGGALRSRTKKGQQAQDGYGDQYQECRETPLPPGLSSAGSGVETALVTAVVVTAVVVTAVVVTAASRVEMAQAG